MAILGLWCCGLIIAMSQAQNFDKIGARTNIGVIFERQTMEVQMVSETYQLTYNIKLPELHEVLPLAPIETTCSLQMETVLIKSAGRNRQVNKPATTPTRCQLLNIELRSLQEQVNIDVERINALKQDLGTIMDDLRYASRDNRGLVDGVGNILTYLFGTAKQSR